MDAESRETGMEPIQAVAGEPAIFGRLAAREDHPHLPTLCPACGGADLLTEQAVDAEREPTGLLLVICGSCGRQVGELARPAAGPTENVIQQGPLPESAS